jgi:hypothetical protein
MSDQNGNGNSNPGDGYVPGSGTSNQDPVSGQGFSNQGAAGQEPANQGFAGQEPFNQGYAGQEPPNQGYAEQVPPNQGYAEQVPFNQGYAGQVPPNQGYAGQVPPNQGQAFDYGASNQGYAAPYSGYGQPGQQPYYAPEYPPEVRKWNWGAFMFNWIWGVGNSAYLSLLALVPCLGLIWCFICGAYGNRWAWKSGEFKDLDSFLTTQRTWNKAGLLYFIIMVVIYVGTFLITVVFGYSLFAILSDIGNSYYY